MEAERKAEKVGTWLRIRATMGPEGKGTDNERVHLAEGCPVTGDHTTNHRRHRSSLGCGGNLTVKGRDVRLGETPELHMHLLNLILGYLSKIQKNLSFDLAARGINC